MNILEVFLQFGTVFVGAFLAFVLENLRERQQLRRWANEYLRRVRIDLQQSKSEETLAELDRVIAAYTSFIAKEENHVASEAAWNALMWFRLEQHPTYQALTESAAARALPAELVQTLDTLDDAGRAVEVTLHHCHSAWQQYTVPLVLRMSPLSAPERRGLEYVEQLLTIAGRYIEKRRKYEVQVLELLDEHKLGR